MSSRAVQRQGRLRYPILFHSRRKDPIFGHNRLMAKERRWKRGTPSDKDISDFKKEN